MTEKYRAPFSCQYCGAPSYIATSDQEPPPDYCHESDHGTSDDMEALDDESMEKDILGVDTGPTEPHNSHE